MAFQEKERYFFENNVNKAYQMKIQVYIMKQKAKVWNNSYWKVYAINYLKYQILNLRFWNYFIGLKCRTVGLLIELSYNCYTSMKKKHIDEASKTAAKKIKP